MSDEIDPYDPESLAIPAGMTAAVIPSKRVPRHRKGEKFLRGPIPMDWIETASALPGKARRRLDALLAESGHTCHWCNRPLVRASAGLVPVTPSARIKVVRQTCDLITWMDGDVERTAYWATADHIVPICEGGNSSMSNLVAACPPCNRGRTANYRDPNPDPPKWIAPTCKCGKSKQTYEKRCGECQRLSNSIADAVRRFYVFKEPGHCRRCLTSLIPLGSFGHVFFYKCPTCKKDPVAQRTEHPASIGNGAGSIPAGVTVIKNRHITRATIGMLIATGQVHPDSSAEDIAKVMLGRWAKQRHIERIRRLMFGAISPGGSL